MSKQQHRQIRGVLRKFGPMFVVAGLLCLVIAIGEFFLKAGTFERPRFFWLAFLGMPLLFAGLAMSIAGYAGKIARYSGHEYGPAASKTFNEIARGSRSGISAIATALRGAGRDASSSTPAQNCPACGEQNDHDAKFCRACGEPTPTTQTCPACGHTAEPGANFCDKCGVALESD